MSSSPIPADVQIPRIPADAELFRRYMAERKPVVVQGLFDDVALGKITTLEQVRASFGGGKVAARGNYMNGIVGQLESFTNGTIGARQLYQKVVTETRLTVAEYMDLVRESGGREPFMRYLNEQAPPPEVMTSMGQPKFFTELGVTSLVPGTDDPELDATYAPTAGRAVFFMANEGNAGDCHTDWDGRHVLNHQVAGRKRFIVLPPDAGLKLSSVEVFLMPRFRRMPDEERWALLRYAGGQEYVIEPGEAVYMPPFFFHHIDYVTDALGVAVRFGEPPRKVMDLMFETHRDLFMQNLWARLIQDPDAPAHVDALRRIEAALAEKHPSRLAKYNAIHELSRELCLAWNVFPSGDAVAPWVSQTQLLRRPLSTSYLRPPAAWSERRRKWWQIKETSRLAAATLASRVVSMIERPS